MTAKEYLMLDKEMEIRKRLISDYHLVKSMGYTVLGVFLQGSQNYGLDYEGSDIDTKVIVIPSFDDIILNHRPVSHTHILPSNEHVDLKDIRLMHDCFHKQNINFLEILFTQYRMMNSEFYDLYRPMFDNAEEIANYNNYAKLNCLCGMIYEKAKAMEHPYPTLIEKIEKYGYDPKQLHHIVRCSIFMSNHFMNDGTFRDCLWSDETTRSQLIGIKKGDKTLEEARLIRDRHVSFAKWFHDDYFSKHELQLNKKAEEIMNQCLHGVIAASLKKELLKEEE